MEKNNSVKLIECITTWQGEGLDVGKRMLIVRFKYCNLNCSWCDTQVKMRVQHEATHTLEDLQKIIDEEKCGLMITGGEPTIARHFDDTLLLLNDLSYHIANVETNGYKLEELISKTDKANVNFTYSPKIFMGDDLRLAMDTTKIFRYQDNVYFKIVYENNELVISYLDFLSKQDINHRVFLMPEGSTRRKLMEHAPEVFDACERYKFNFSSREHIIYSFV